MSISNVLFRLRAFNRRNFLRPSIITFRRWQFHFFENAWEKTFFTHFNYKIATSFSEFVRWRVELQSVAFLCNMHRLCPLRSAHTKYISCPCPDNCLACRDKADTRSPGCIETSQSRLCMPSRLTHIHVRHCPSSSLSPVFLRLCRARFIVLYQQSFGVFIFFYYFLLRWFI